MVEANPSSSSEKAAAPSSSAQVEGKSGQSLDIEKQMEAYYARQLVHGRTLFSYERDNVVQEGDTVIFFEKHDLQKQVIVKRG